MVCRLEGKPGAGSNGVALKEWAHMYLRPVNVTCVYMHMYRKAARQVTVRDKYRAETETTVKSTRDPFRVPVRTGSALGDSLLGAGEGEDW